MELSEKLRELRKSRSLTQEELAEALFVSRTAVSKWESGRGYPSIDSLKEIARFFSVPIDELLQPDEIISVAENDKKTFTSKYASLTCGVLDAFLIILLFLPVFGHGAEAPSVASLFGLAGVNRWMAISFAATIGVAALTGFCETIVANFDKPAWSKRLIATGMALSITAVALFIGTRQPYAGIICFALLIAKSLVVLKAK